MRAGLDDTGEVVDVPHGRIAEGLARTIEHLHGCATDVEMNPATADPEIALRREAMDRGLRRRHSQQRFSNLAWQAQAAVITLQSAMSLQSLETSLRRSGHANPLQEFKGRTDHRVGIGFIERLQRATLMARPDHRRRRFGHSARSAAARGTDVLLGGSGHHGSGNSGAHAKESGPVRSIPKVSAHQTTDSRRHDHAVTR